MNVRVYSLIAQSGMGGVTLNLQDLVSTRMGDHKESQGVKKKDLCALAKKAT